MAQIPTSGHLLLTPCAGGQWKVEAVAVGIYQPTQEWRFESGRALSSALSNSIIIPERDT